MSVDKECFICLQDLESGGTTVRLKHHHLYKKRCKCDGYIHESCLEDWLYTTQSCPICRTPMYSEDPPPTFACAVCIFCTSGIFSLAIWLFYCY